MQEIGKLTSSQRFRDGCGSFPVWSELKERE
jgi:hypothetical protein